VAAANPGLALPLLVARVLLVDDVNTAFTPNDLIVLGAFFNGSANFHALLQHGITLAQHLPRGCRVCESRGRSPAAGSMGV